MDRLTDLLKDTLQNITGKTLTGDYQTLDLLLNAFNNQYVCAVTFSNTPVGTTIVVKQGTTTIAPDESGKYHLKEGSYTYDATATGYVSKLAQTLTITNTDETTGTKTVTVTLTAATYNIVYMDGETPVALEPSTYIFGTGATLNDGSTIDNFVSWHTNAELTSEAVTTVSTSEFGDKTYYAKTSV